VIDPPTLVSNEPIEMSDWEVHDLAIQIVASYVDKSCAALSKQPSLHIDPSVWFRDEHGPAYVVVRSARFPRTDAPRPANLPAIMASSRQDESARLLCVGGCGQRRTGDSTCRPWVRCHYIAVTAWRLTSTGSNHCMTHNIQMVSTRQLSLRSRRCGRVAYLE
jgi:hypothetical protein